MELICICQKKAVPLQAGMVITNFELCILDYCTEKKLRNQRIINNYKILRNGQQKTCLHLR